MDLVFRQKMIPLTLGLYTYQAHQLRQMQTVGCWHVSAQQQTDLLMQMI